MCNVHVMIKLETSFIVKYMDFLFENLMLNVLNESKYLNIETDF